VRDRAERSSTRTRATNNGGLSGSDPQFTEDPAAADQSVRRLAAPAPRTILVGHGPPVPEDAAAALEQGLARLTSPRFARRGTPVVRPTGGLTSSGMSRTPDGRERREPNRGFRPLA
jgi:glyoxylase-like metal-dependent hydrolase (beta-lactamase superfamily II)